MDSSVTVGIPGVVSLRLGSDTVRSLSDRFTRRTLFSGPCLIIDRWSGLALDATTHPEHRTRPVLWTVHGLPWQQWRLVREGNRGVHIVSEHGGLALTTDPVTRVGDRSWVWLEKSRASDQQRWRIRPLEDRSAFVIETIRSGHALDATTDPQVPASTESRNVGEPTPPVLWSTHEAPWQQWVVVRLPLS